MRVIFFDIGGVLLNVHPDRTLGHLAVSTSLPEDVFHGVFEGEIYQRYETGGLTDREFYRAIEKTLPQPNNLTQDIFFEAWIRVVGEPTGTMALAKDLTGKIPVWLASNTNPFHIRYGNSRAYFDEFDGKIYSFEIGVRKPSEEFFQKALETTGFEAGSSLFIDDQKRNVEAADKLGFNAIHYQSDDQLRRELDGFF